MGKFLVARRAEWKEEDTRERQRNPRFPVGASASIHASLPVDSAGRELGTVTKKWAGIGKELFTSADTYLIALSDAAPSGANQVALLLAAGLAIDVVFKEKK
jgi:Scramblase